MMKVHILTGFIILFLFNDVLTFKALDSYEMDAGKFPIAPDGSTPITKVLTRFYIKKDGTCDKFYYKGSGGNFNNFGTEHECKQHLADLSKWELLDGCSEGAKLEGPCTKSGVTRYYYDSSSSQCSQFNYGGCGGNNNRFKTSDDCQRACKVGANSAPNEFDCDLPPKYPESSTLKVAIVKSQNTETRCAYAVVDNSVTRGIFTSFSQCLNKCHKTQIGACRTSQHQPTGSGNNVIKFYYKQSEKKCLPFLTKPRTGGFNPSQNYFDTEEECMSYCPVDDNKVTEMLTEVSKDACSINAPTLSGSLTGTTKYYYKSSAHTCTSATYGGVGNIDGLFDSSQECMEMCSTPAPPPPPPPSGP